jgi:hypothetical protein
MTTEKQKKRIPPERQKQCEAEMSPEDTLYSLKKQIFGKRKRRRTLIKKREALIPREKRRL